MTQFFCSNCGAPLASGSSFCTRCGFGNSVTAGDSRPRRRGSGRAWWIVGTIFVVLIAGIVACVVLFRDFVAARSTAFQEPRIEREVFAHAEHFGPVLDALGSPVTGDCCASVRWTDGRPEVHMPVHGPRGKGELVASLHNDEDHGWELDRFVLNPASGPPIDLLPAPVPAAAADLAGDGKIYFIPIGPQAVPIEQVAAHYRQKFGLDVTVLPPMPLPDNAFVAARKQYAAEDLVDAFRKLHFDLANDSHAYLIGVTHADIFIRSENWVFTYGLRDGERSAVVSTARMYDRYWSSWGWLRGSGLSATDLHQIELRERQMITKDIALQYWRLPMSRDPKSVTVNILTPDDRPDDILQSDVHPENTIYGLSLDCLHASYDHASYRVELPTLRTCEDHVQPALGQDVIWLNTGDGHFWNPTTDFALPAGFPIQLIRVYTNVRGMEVSFGPHSWLNYNASIDYEGNDKDDLQLTVHPLGYTYTFQRISEKRGYAGKYQGFKDSSDYFGAIGWNPAGRIEITRTNGQREAYYLCIAFYGCVLQELRRPGYGVVKVDRDRNNSELTIISSDAANLMFEYDDAHRITSIRASDGSSAAYTYNAQGCLDTVTRGDSSTHYTYDENCQLTDITITDTRGSFLLLHAQYADGRVASVDMGGKVYAFTYAGEGDKVKCQTVTLPDGRVLDVFSGTAYLRPSNP